jgi:phosphoenolpyruvate carboxylase
MSLETSQPLRALPQDRRREQLELWLDESRAEDHARRLSAAHGIDLTRLIARAKTPENLAAELARIRIVPVLTSHPSEMRPPEVLAALAKSDDRASAYKHLRATSTRVRLERPTVAHEVETLLAHFERVLFDAVPDFYEAVEQAAFARFGKNTPPIPNVFRFHSWVGCDRDGNPECTAAATLAAAEQMHRCVIERYRRDLRHLAHLCAGEAEAFFRRIHDALTIRDHTSALSSAEFAAELKASQNLDLSDTTRYELARLRRRHGTFGFHLATLEWRQHSDYILYTFDEREHVVHQERRHFAELDTHFQTARIRESFRDERRLEDYEHLLVTPKAKEVVQSLRILGEIRKRYGAEAVGEIIISNCEESTVVLALERLARDAGVYDCGEIQIVPLFESLSALEHGPRMLETLLAEPLIRKKIARLDERFEVMVGYSDAAKDGGRIAADILIARAQRALIDACFMHGVVPRIFHGRGGTPGRGAADFAEAAQKIDLRLPPGELKITEQGEVVANRYGHPVLAAHTLRSWFTQAMENLRSEIEQTHQNLEAELFALETRVARSAAFAFRALREDQTFMASVRALTPLDVVRECPLSSRPASRSTGLATAMDLASLRAVPFNMAFNLVFAQIPAWYGTGTALEDEMQHSGASLLQYAYQHRPVFRNAIALAVTALEAGNLAVMRERSKAAHEEAFFAQVAQEEERARTLIGEIVGDVPQPCPLPRTHAYVAQILQFLDKPDVEEDTYANYLAIATIAAVIGMTG